MTCEAGEATERRDAQHDGDGEGGSGGYGEGKGIGRQSKRIVAAVKRSVHQKGIQSRRGERRLGGARTERGAGPAGASSRRRRENGWEDATADAKGGKGWPCGGRNGLAERRGTTGRVGRRVGEGEWSEEIDIGVEKG